MQYVGPRDLLDTLSCRTLSICLFVRLELVYTHLALPGRLADLSTQSEPPKEFTPLVCIAPWKPCLRSSYCVLLQQIGKYVITGRTVGWYVFFVPLRSSFGV
jgi:hypothetical protein